MRLPPVSEEFPEIPVVPLIDVMFTLLTFFIVATLLIQKTRTIDLNLPQASNEVSTTPPKQVDITVDKGGKFYFNKQLVTRQELAALAARLPDETLIILAGDEKARYQDITRAMDALREAGKASRIALAARALK
ncbi:ExbD/TolR family protein [Anthocerotibacter panamensis]|uniref:ExbD/TolR family protein n=1 Tax=Anthocerotibacter panamensis TaxID=2857077 RepID=UPI001C4082FB|nr:biopolymer transporter ExbD [Anthocerotibacter panamensis]